MYFSHIHGWALSTSFEATLHFLWSHRLAQDQTLKKLKESSLPLKGARTASLGTHLDTLPWCAQAAYYGSKIIHYLLVDKIIVGQVPMYGLYTHEAIQSSVCEKFIRMIHRTLQCCYIKQSGWWITPFVRYFFFCDCYVWDTLCKYSALSELYYEFK